MVLEGCIKTNNKHGLVIVFTVALAARLIALHFFPTDWNWDSYHHWQISFLSLKVGFSQGRLWDLNGCEYYWGMVPHLVQSGILWALNTTSIQPYRVFNVLFGSINAVLVYINGRERSESIGYQSGLLYSLFPFAILFDILGLQDTVALTFLLTSLHLSNRYPFWAGAALALAAQSRNEILLISFVIVAWVMFIERMSTDRMPFLIGWLVITMAFAWYMFSQTGNPVYGLYWNLHNVFTSGGLSKANGLLDAALKWVTWKLSVWPSKPSGIIIITAAFTTFAYFLYSLKRKPRNYSMVFFLSTVTLTAPIYLTYLGSEPRMFLIMARTMNPVAALGLPLLMTFFSKLFHGQGTFSPFTALTVLFITSTLILTPSYLGFQEETNGTMKIAEKVGVIYRGGTIVCDYPMMNYHLFNRWHIDSTKIIGSHYAPHYYGSSSPNDHLIWLWNKKVTLFIRYGEDSEIVFNMVNSFTNSVFVNEFEQLGIECYSVDSNEILKALI